MKIDDIKNKAKQLENKVGEMVDHPGDTLKKAEASVVKAAGTVKEKAVEFGHAHEADAKELLKKTEAGLGKVVAEAKELADDVKAHMHQDKPKS